MTAGQTWARLSDPEPTWVSGQLRRIRVEDFVYFPRLSLKVDLWGWPYTELTVVQMAGEDFLTLVEGF